MLILACVVASYADPDAAGDAAAYGGMSFNRELPYVPRYRYVRFIFSGFIQNYTYFHFVPFAFLLNVSASKTSSITKV